MLPPIEPGLVAKASDWPQLHRWERAELGRALRRAGLSYGEIRELIPVPKGTLSNWCRDIRLTLPQLEALAARTADKRSLPRDTQHKRRAQVAQLRSRAHDEAPRLLAEPLWLAGTALYWAEGSKTPRCLEMANADPALLRLFLRWVRRYLAPVGGFVMALHLHAGNDEAAAKTYWMAELDLPDDFHKTFIKPAGTGHRKNTLAYGVCRVRLRRSADAFVTAMAWVDWLSERVGDPALTSSVGR